MLTAWRHRRSGGRRRVPWCWWVLPLILFLATPRSSRADISQVTVIPSTTTGTVGLSSALAATWAITFTAGTCSFPEAAQSRLGTFTTDSFSPSSSNTLGTVPLTLQTASINASGTLTAPETILITQEIASAGLARGLGSIFYQRRWDDSCGSVTARLTIRLVSGAAGPFSIARYEIRFEKGESTITVPRGLQGLKAFADLQYNGTGTLRARWRVAEPGALTRVAEQLAGRPLVGPGGLASRFPLDDWRILAELRRTLTFGDRVVLPSPDAPGLPAFSTGQHLVTLEILEGLPGDAIFPFQFPLVRYFVEDRGGRAVAGGPGGGVRLLAPPDEARLPMAVPTFEWAGVPGAMQYRLEIFEMDPRPGPLAGPGGEPGPGVQGAVSRLEALGPRVLSALSSGPVTRLALHPAYLGRFRPRQIYLWKVLALSGTGDLLATSLARAFLFVEP